MVIAVVAIGYREFFKLKQEELKQQEQIKKIEEKKE